MDSNYNIFFRKIMMIGVLELINKIGSLPIEISFINSLSFNIDFDIFLLKDTWDKLGNQLL
jgi:hypothetical protein